MPTVKKPSNLLSAIAAAAFSLADKYEDGDYVIYPERKLFEEGDYPSHKFSKTAEELVADAAATEEVELDLHHEDTVIRDEYIGKGRNFKAIVEDGKTQFMGDIAIHKLLDPLLKPETRMSTTWDRETGKLSKIALLLNPKIKDAALNATFATFSAEFAKEKHDTRSGQRAHQKLHDMAAEMGAICKQSNVPAKSASFASTHEAKGLQTIHDTAVEHGASCEGASGTTYGSYYFSEADDADSEVGQEEEHMDASTGENKGKPTTSSPDLEAKFAAQEARTKELEDKLAKAQRDARSTKAAAFADRFIVTEEKVKPGMRSLLVNFAETLIEADEDGAEIQFSDTEKGSLLKGLETILSAAKPLGLTKERVAAFSDVGGRALGEDDVDNDGMKAASRRVAAKALHYAGVKTATGDSKNGNGKS